LSSLKEERDVVYSMKKTRKSTDFGTSVRSGIGAELERVSSHNIVDADASCYQDYGAKTSGNDNPCFNHITNVQKLYRDNCSTPLGSSLTALDILKLSRRSPGGLGVYLSQEERLGIINRHKTWSKHETFGPYSYDALHSSKMFQARFDVSASERIVSMPVNESIQIESDKFCTDEHDRAPSPQFDIDLDD